ncbi:MAG TPA: class I SAM-dependent methyltransferase [Bacteroidia bacterium]|nr:class I SAM-dependent methyltransferase [Bacteroidia bacterium]
MAFNRITDFISYYMGSVNEHGIHSPFVFKLLTESVYLKTKEPAFDQIEKIRSQLFADKRIIEITDLGAGSRYDGVPQKRKVADMTRRFAKSPKYGRLLFRLVNHLKPKVMVELGTSLGISAMYQSAGNPAAVLYTLEGDAATAALATANFQTASFNAIKTITGNFNDTLPTLLINLGVVDYVFIDGNHTYEATMNYFRLLKKHKVPTTVLVFDDIHWSNEMYTAWKEIKADPEVTISIDFFALGLVFFNPDFTKQEFIIRY